MLPDFARTDMGRNIGAIVLELGGVRPSEVAMWPEHEQAFLLTIMEIQSDEIKRKMGGIK